MASRKKKRLISVVIPVFNEEESLPTLLEELKTILKTLPYTFEILFIDDGSTDSSLGLLRSFRKKDARMKILSFSRNFGHQAALRAGLDFARGDAVITMDADLQHPPRVLPAMIEKWNEGFDIVYTVRESTKGVSRLKEFSARWFYRVMNWIGNIHVPPNTPDFRLLSRGVVNELRKLHERALFLRGLVQWVGFRQASVSFTAEMRRAGKVKYSFFTMVRFAMSGITAFSNAPLMMAFFLGITASFFSFLYALYVVYMRIFTTESIPGWAGTLFAILFLGGVQLVTIGIIGIYLGRLYEEVKQRPRYIIRHQEGDFPNAG